MKKTAVIGVSFVDIKGFVTENYIHEGTNLGEISMVHGGVGCNVAENLANIAVPVTFVSLKDNSSMGIDVSNYLKQCGVDQEYCVQSENGIGIWMAILNKRGNIVANLSCMPDILPLERLIFERGAEIISGAENIVLEMGLNENITERVLELAEDNGKDVFVIIGNMQILLENKKYLKNTRCFICNALEAGLVFGRDLKECSIDKVLDILPEEARKLGIRSMVVTLGEKGAVYFDSKTEEKGYCPAIQTDVVDTTGAGDAFFGAVVAALGNGKKLEDAVKYGTKLASMTISSKVNSCPRNADFLNQDIEKLFK